MSFYKGSKKIAGLIRGEDISHATETHAGIIEIANSAEALAGTVDTKAITPKKMKDTLSDVAYSGEYDELLGTPTNLSDFNNDPNYQTDTQVSTSISNHNTSNSAHDDIRQSINTITSTISTYGNIVTHNTSEFATSAQGAKADTAVQPATLSGYVPTSRKINGQTLTQDLTIESGLVDDVKVNGTSVVTNKVANIDLTIKQNVTDNTLTTTDKTIVGAINEINAKPSMPDLDEVTITTNSDDELQAIGVIDSRDSSTPLRYWTGTKAQYDAITTKDSNTLYNITDDTDVTLTLLNTLYPVGAIYIGTMATCPLATLGVGTWQLKASDRVLQGAGTRGSVGDTLSESLPKPTLSTTGTHGHNICQWNQNNTNYTAQRWNSTGTATETSPCGAIHPSGHLSWQSSSFKTAGAEFFSGSGDLAGVTNSVGNHTHTVSGATYQDNAPVQQDAYLVNIWERIS